MSAKMKTKGTVSTGNIREKQQFPRYLLSELERDNPPQLLNGHKLLEHILLVHIRDVSTDLEHRKKEEGGRKRSIASTLVMLHSNPYSCSADENRHTGACMTYLPEKFRARTHLR